MDLSTICLWGAALVFALEAFHLTTPQVSWTPLGFCLVVLSFLL